MLTLDDRDRVDELVQVAPNVEGRSKIWQVYYRKQSLEQQNFRLKACLTRVGVVGQWTPTRQSVAEPRLAICGLVPPLIFEGFLTLYIYYLFITFTQKKVD